MADVYPGNVIRLTGTFTVSGTATDPTTVTLKVLPPGATTATSYTYALSQLTKSATGVYYKDYTIATHGDFFYYDFIGTGTCVSFTEQAFYVMSPKITYVAPV